MAPARVEDDEDPVTAEYDVFLTPAQQEQIFLLQYPNRNRDRPYNERLGVSPREMRVKPTSGHLELDVKLNTEHNFNKYRGLKWGDALRTGKEVQNENATYGLASGFSGLKMANARRAQLKDQVDRELELQNDLSTFYDAEKDDKVMHTQTLGGQILKHNSPHESGKPLYFVGAFRGTELHLTEVTGTVQMRPQFHHLDAEDQRTRIASSRAVAAENPAASSNVPEVARVVHQSYKSTPANPRGELEQREHEMKSALQNAYEEPWVRMDYVDEDATEAFRLWDERMFVKDVAAAPKLQSAMGNAEYLDAISAPGRESPTRRRRKAPRKREAVDANGAEPMEADEDDGAAG